MRKPRSRSGARRRARLTALPAPVAARSRTSTPIADAARGRAHSHGPSTNTSTPSLWVPASGPALSQRGDARGGARAERGKPSRRYSTAAQLRGRRGGLRAAHSVRRRVARVWKACLSHRRRMRGGSLPRCWAARGVSATGAGGGAAAWRADRPRAAGRPEYGEARYTDAVAEYRQAVEGNRSHPPGELAPPRCSRRASAERRCLRPPGGEDPTRRAEAAEGSRASPARRATEQCGCLQESTGLQAVPRRGTERYALLLVSVLTPTPRTSPAALRAGGRHDYRRRLR
jgi:hypothetical protein